jgi:hypothetical protein
MGKKVFIMSIPRKTATGLSDARNPTSGELIGKNKIKKANTKFMCLYSPLKGGLNNYISYTPHIDPTTGLEARNKNGEPIMLQEVLEKKYAKPAGYYTNAPVTKNQEEKDITFYQTTYWILEDGTTMFDLDTELGELGYYAALESPLIANSEREYREHKWPKAEFYIAIENESDDIKYNKNKVKSKAFAALEDPALSDTFRRKFVVLLGLANTKANLTIEKINNMLFEYIDSSSFSESSNISKFMVLFNQFKTAKGKETIEVRYIIQQALDLRIMFEKQNTYTWVRPTGNITLGERYEDAVEFMLNPKKAAEVDEIIEEIKKKA